MQTSTLRAGLLACALVGGTSHWCAAQTPAPAEAGARSPHEGMTLVFEDNFDGTALDLTKWYPGGKPSSGHQGGEQWSDSHFVSADEPNFADTYRVKDGILTLRATYDAAYKDPQNWGRKWYGAEISSAFPDGRVSGSLRKGYTEVRMKLPAGKGSWPAFWMLETASIDKTKTNGGIVEIDVFEHYGFPHNFNPGIHDWGPGGKDTIVNGIGNVSTKPEITADFHTYGCLLTDNEVVYYFDGAEVFRKPLPRAGAVTPFYLLLDMAVGGGWKVEVPPSGHYDTDVDYVRIWQ